MDIRNAIARKKEIKAWRREKKIRLIERENPTWNDLGADLAAKNYAPISKPGEPRGTNGST